MRRTSILLLSLAALFFTPSATEACSCVGGIPLCESAWTSDAVFSGEVLSVQRMSNETKEPFSSVRVRFKVLESWRGDVSGVVEVKTGLGGGDCGYSFREGMTYLVYADSRRGGLSTGICSRTRPLSQAGEDLAYLRTAMNPSAAGRIFGTVQYQWQRNPDGGSTPERLISGYPVTLSDGKQTWKAVTDKSGHFEFTVPAGTYTIALAPARSDRANGQRTITLADSRGCAAAHFYVSPDR